MSSPMRTIYICGWHKRSSRYDLSGQTFGDLKVVRFTGKNTKNKTKIWECLCTCGSTTEVPTHKLKEGSTSSCGCRMIENQAKANTRHGQSVKGKETKLYRIWSGMVGRCLVSTSGSYFNYGGRGIKLWRPWRYFEEFEQWAILSGYKDGMSIERIDVNGNYCPSNCTWIPLKDQAFNRKTTIRLILNDKEFIPCKYYRRYKEEGKVPAVHYVTFLNRVRRGIAPEKAIAYKTERSILNV